MNTCRREVLSQWPLLMLTTPLLLRAVLLKLNQADGLTLIVPWLLAAISTLDSCKRRKMVRAVAEPSWEFTRCCWFPHLNNFESGTPPQEEKSIMEHILFKCCNWNNRTERHLRSTEKNKITSSSVGGGRRQRIWMGFIVFQQTHKGCGCLKRAP